MAKTKDDAAPPADAPSLENLVQKAVADQVAELKRWMRKEIHLAACAASLEEREQLNP